MSSEEFESRKRAELNAITSLRSAFFIGILASLLNPLIVGLAEFAILSSVALNTVTAYENPIAWLITIAVAESVSLFFVTLYLYALDRSRRMVLHFVRDFDIIKWGVILFGIGAVTNTIFTILSINSGLDIFSILSSPLVLLWAAGGIASFVGLVIIAIAIAKVANNYDNHELKIYGYLIIILGFIGLILVYSELGKVLTRIEKRLPPPPAPPWVA